MEKEIKKSVVRRLKILEGQVRGLERMVENEKYCIEIITQASAIKEALSGVQDSLLENHLATHVVAQMRTGKKKQSIEEILKIYKLAKRK